MHPDNLLYNPDVQPLGIFAVMLENHDAGVTASLVPNLTVRSGTGSSSVACRESPQTPGGGIPSQKVINSINFAFQLNNFTEHKALHNLFISPDNTEMSFPLYSVKTNGSKQNLYCFTCPAQGI